VSACPFVCLYETLRYYVKTAEHIKDFFNVLCYPFMQVIIELNAILSGHCRTLDRQRCTTVTLLFGCCCTRLRRRRKREGSGKGGRRDWFLNFIIRGCASRRTRLMQAADVAVGLAHPHPVTVSGPSLMSRTPSHRYYFHYHSNHFVFHHSKLPTMHACV